MRAIVDASPLIYLSKLGILEMLNQVFESVTTTEVVKNEVLVPSGEYTLLVKSFNSWLITKENVNKEIEQDLINSLKIHSGEASVLALAMQEKQTNQDMVVVIDDLVEREIAKTLEIPIVGTLGIILMMKKREKITSKKAKELLIKLITDTPFRISAKLYQKVLDQVE
ncbi:MAG: DUF3368 domain-containing protein [Candidatus Kariarchaeaceae archaeon]